MSIAKNTKETFLEEIIDNLSGNTRELPVDCKPRTREEVLLSEIEKNTRTRSTSGTGSSSINDENISNSTTWSSEKIVDYVSETSENAKGDLQEQIDEVNSQLEHKANDSEVVKKGYGTLNDFTEDTRRVLQGLEEGQINAVLGKGNVMLDNLNEEIVEFIKGNNLVTSTQSFSYNTNTYNCTNFIDAKIGDKFSINITWTFMLELDANNNVVGEYSLATTTSRTIQNEECKKIVFTCRNSTTDFVKNGTVVVKGDINSYIPDEYKFNIDRIPILSGDNIKDGSLTIEKLDETFTTIEKGTNLYKYDEHLNDYTIKDSNNSNITTNNFTNFIEVTPGVQYASSVYYTQFYFLNSNKEYLSQTTILSNPAIFTPPVDSKYVLIRCNANEDIKICEGTSIENVTNDKTIINPVLLPSSVGGYESRWKNKKWIVIGDSISVLAEKNYHDFVGKDLGMIVSNLSVSGRTMLDGIKWVDTMPSDYDLVTVMMGTNDHGYNCDIGYFNDGCDFNTNNSFYSKVQEMIRKLRAKNPKAQIVMITPIRRYGTASQQNNEDGFMINALGKTTKDYGDVIKDCCDRLGVHCLDLYECGLDPRDENIRGIYFMGVGDGTHPSVLGQATFLAPKVRDFLEKIAPYDV